MIALIVLAMMLDPADSTIRGALVVGLVLSLAGDILLLPGGDRWFLTGLVSFLLAHVAYIVGLLLAPTTPWGPPRRGGGDGDRGGGVRSAGGRRRGGR